MAILRIASIVLVSSLLFATAASAELGQRDGRRGDRDRPSPSPNRPDARPSRPEATIPVIVRPEVVRPVVRPVPLPKVIYEPRRPSYRFWQRDRDFRDHRDFRNHRNFRGRHNDRRW